MHYFFDDMINIRNIYPNKIKTDKKSYKNVLNYLIGCVNVKDLSYAIINIGNPLYLIINKINEWLEKSNGNKYMTLVPTDESKDKLKNTKNYGTKLEIVLDQWLIT